MKRNNFLIIPTVALILLIFALLSIITPMLMDMVETPINTHDDTAAYNLALSGLELAQAEKPDAGTTITIDFLSGESCSVLVEESTLTATATYGNSTRILSAPYSTSNINDGDGDIVFIPGDVIGGGGSVDDNSGYDNNANNVGTDIVGDAEGPWEDDTPVLEFDGANDDPQSKNGDYLEIPDAASLDLADKGAIACWVKITPSTGKHETPVIMKGTELRNFSYGLFVDDDGRGLGANEYVVKLAINDISSGNAVELYSQSVIESNKWVHIGASWDQVDGMRVYINGEIDAADSSQKPTAQVNDLSLYLGNYEGQEKNSILIGQLYYPVVLKRSFVPVEVESLYLDRRLHYALEGVGNATYPASGAGKAVDGVIFTNHADLRNGVDTSATNEEANPSTAYAFDATQNQYLSRDSLAWDLNGSHTIISIFHPDSYLGNMTLFEIPDHYKVTIAQDSITLFSNWVKNSSGNSFTLSAPITKDSWHTFALTCSNNTCKIYMDGTEVGSTAITPDSLTPPPGATSQLYIGASESGSDTFNGKIDDFTVFGYALDSIQIAGGSDTPLAQPLASWKFEEPWAGEYAFYNSTSDNYHGLGWVSERGQPGVIGNCFYFNTWSKLYVSNNMVSDYPFTINMWIKTNGKVSGKPMPCFDIGVNNSGTYPYYRMELTTNGYPQLIVRTQKNNAITSSPIEGHKAVDDDNWHMLTAVFKSGNLALYLDGRLYANTTEAAPFIAINTSLIIGNYTSSSGGFKGWIDEVKLFDTSLSADEIMLYYQSEQP